MVTGHGRKARGTSLEPRMHAEGPRWTLLGLTGGVGMGKSVAAGFLRGFGLPVVDTDLLARELVLPGQPALEEIRGVFGDAVMGDDGHLRRDVLAAMVFGDEARRRQLETILHPRIRAAWLDQVRAWKASVISPPDPAGRAGVVVVPLLFETGAECEFRATVCVACSAASQSERLAARGWSAAQAEQRIRAQWPIEQKLAAADFVVWAEGGLDRTREQLERILRELGFSDDEKPASGQPAGTRQ